MSGWPSDFWGGLQVFSVAVGVWPAADTGVSDKTAIAAAMAMVKPKNPRLI
jgi:hypothetical protein